MTYIIWSNIGYMELDGNCKENIPSQENYMTFKSKEDADEYIKKIKEDDNSCWRWAKSLKVEQAWWEVEEENENN